MSSRLIAGIDVSAKVVDVAVEVDGKQLAIRQFDNNASGHSRLLHWLKTHGRSVRVVVESTGIYSLDLALALQRCEDTEVMVVQASGYGLQAAARTARPWQDYLVIPSHGRGRSVPEARRARAFSPHEPFRRLS